jgi:hypothetical protein
VVVLDLPPADGAESAARLCVLECVAGGGIAARLGQELYSKMGGWLPLAQRTFSNGTRRAIALYGPAAPEQVVGIHEAVQKALAGLAARPPGAEEVAAAAARVRLRLLAELARPARWLEHASRTPAPAAGPDPLLATLTALRDPPALDIENAVGALAAEVPTTLGVGGEPPAGAHITLLDELLRAEQRALLVADPEQQETSARPFLDRAVDAFGGKDRLAGIHGYIAKGLTRTGRGPQSQEIEAFDLDQRRLRRVRAVLATVVDTLIVGTVGDDVSDGRTIPLPADEAAAQTTAAACNPVLLVAAWSRGESRYRLVGLRPSSGRNHAVLEAVDDSAGRLRLQIDAESGLVRVVERSEHRTGVGEVFLAEHYRDYRNIDGVRVPHYRTSLIDGSLEGTSTQWELLRPFPPADEFFKRPK